MKSIGEQAILEHDRLVIKVDGEPHEQAVLDGSRCFLSQHAGLPLQASVVCEFVADPHRLELQGLLQEVGVMPWASTFELGNTFWMVDAAAVGCHRGGGIASH